MFSVILRGGRMSEPPVVTVEQGQLQGRVANTPSGKGYYSFQGIPYAKPPLGSLRFKAPQPIEPWDGVRDATSEGNVSAQIDPIFAKQYVGDENCLFLNVYTPSIDGAFLPVMVYIHGGAFKYGSGNTDMYGPDYLVEKDVVVVTINYRLGVLGFLSLDTPEVPGNAGMKDVMLALRWVKENIQNFGGNSGNLTVFGESAGGSASSLVTASPMSKDLINRAIIQSGTALFDWSFQKKPVENARNLAKSLGCEGESVEEILDFLSATSAKEIVEAHERMESLDDLNPNAFVLVVEKEFLGVDAVINEPFINLLTSGRVAHVPIMIGSTTLEYASEKQPDDLQFFIPQDLNIEKNSDEALAIAEKIKELYFKESQPGVESSHVFHQLISDKFINIDTHRYVQYLVQSTNVPIYFYKFDYVGELNISSKAPRSLGLKHPMHLDDLGYLFKNDFQVIITTDIYEKVPENMTKITDKETGVSECVTDDAPKIVDDAPLITNDAPKITDNAPEITNDAPKPTNAAPEITDAAPKITNDVQKLVSNYQKEIEMPHVNGNGIDKPKPRTSNEIKMASSNGAPADVIRANDPPEDDLPKNIGVNKFDT
ncbi:Carboxyl/cholinesterase 5BL [Operophtera brumata]|uniref:Carboxylic ester hydrolase n=1 Tax=Operophtera brumata TaxID=104452 RepID=A0A0L7LCM8_OPEBR|nr:Carboxyl/cholinesterase 5BL [Operophtera brumata]